MYLLKYVLKRLGLLLMVFLVIFTLCFVLVKLLPNTPDPQPGKDYELIMKRREMLGYDKPIMEQYMIYLFGRRGYTYDEMENAGTIVSDNLEFKQRVTFNKEGNPAQNGIKLTVTNSARVTFYGTAMSIGEEEKIVGLYDGNGALVSGTETQLSTGMGKFRFTLPAAGTYYISGSNRVNVYYVSVETDANGANPVQASVNFSDVELTEDNKVTSNIDFGNGISLVTSAQNPITLAPNGNKIQSKNGSVLQWETKEVLDENGEVVYVQDEDGNYLDENGVITTDPTRFVAKTEFVLDEEGEQIPIFSRVTVYDREKLPAYATDYSRKMVGGIIRGEFGVSEVLYKGSDVWEIFASKVPYTIALNVYAIIFSIPIGLALGVYAALRKNKWQDHVISTGVMIFVSVPSFIYAFLVHYVLYFKLGWTPATANALDGPWSPSFFASIIGAILSMSFGTIAGFARYTRAELSEVLTNEYMLLARTKGLTKAQAVIRHAMRNAMVVLFPMILGEFLSIMSGSLIIEQIFSIPGVGKLYIGAIQAQPTPDYNFFMLLTGFYTLLSLAAGIIIDISYGIIDPRIRMGAR